MKELWKEIHGFNSLYQVSNLGRVKSFKCLDPDGRILKPTPSRNYYQVGLYMDGICEKIFIHKLVAIAFIKKPASDGTKLMVDHINNDPKDNRSINLQWITHRENSSKDKWRGSYTSKYIGVHFDKRSEKWRSGISIMGKRDHLGYFDSEIEASNAYQLKLKKTKI